MLEVALLQGLLLAEVSQTAVVLYLRDTNSGSTYGRQHVGTHLGKYTSHVLQFVTILHSRPLVSAIRQILVVIVTFIVKGIKKVFKVVETDGINRVFLLLCQCVHCSHQEQNDH